MPPTLSATADFACAPSASSSFSRRRWCLSPPLRALAASLVLAVVCLAVASPTLRLVEAQTTTSAYNTGYSSLTRSVPASAFPGVGDVVFGRMEARGDATDWATAAARCASVTVSGTKGTLAIIRSADDDEAAKMLINWNSYGQVNWFGLAFVNNVWSWAATGEPVSTLDATGHPVLVDPYGYQNWFAESNQVWYPRGTGIGAGWLPWEGWGNDDPTLVTGFLCSYHFLMTEYSPLGSTSTTSTFSVEAYPAHRTRSEASAQCAQRQVLRANVSPYGSGVQIYVNGSLAYPLRDFERNRTILVLLEAALDKHTSVRNFSAWLGAVSPGNGSRQLTWQLAGGERTWAALTVGTTSPLSTASGACAPDGIAPTGCAIGFPSGVPDPTTFINAPLASERTGLGAVLRSPYTTWTHMGAHYRLPYACGFFWPTMEIAPIGDAVVEVWPNLATRAQAEARCSGMSRYFLNQMVSGHLWAGSTTLGSEYSYLSAAVRKAMLSSWPDATEMPLAVWGGSAQDDGSGSCGSYSYNGAGPAWTGCSELRPFVCVFGSIVIATGTAAPMPPVPSTTFAPPGATTTTTRLSTTAFAASTTSTTSRPVTTTVAPTTTIISPPPPTTTGATRTAAAPVRRSRSYTQTQTVTASFTRGPLPSTTVTARPTSTTLPSNVTTATRPSNSSTPVATAANATSTSTATTTPGTTAPPTTTLNGTGTSTSVSTTTTATTTRAPATSTPTAAPAVNNITTDNVTYLLSPDALRGVGSAGGAIASLVGFLAAAPALTIIAGIGLGVFDITTCSGPGSALPFPLSLVPSVTVDHPAGAIERGTLALNVAVLAGVGLLLLFVGYLRTRQSKEEEEAAEAAARFNGGGKRPGDDALDATSGCGICGPRWFAVLGAGYLPGALMMLQAVTLQGTVASAVRLIRISQDQNKPTGQRQWHFGGEADYDSYDSIFVPDVVLIAFALIAAVVIFVGAFYTTSRSLIPDRAAPEGSNSGVGPRASTMGPGGYRGIAPSAHAAGPAAVAALTFTPSYVDVPDRDTASARAARSDAASWWFYGDHMWIDSAALAAARAALSDYADDMSPGPTNVSTSLLLPGVIVSILRGQWQFIASKNRGKTKFAKNDDDSDDDDGSGKQRQSEDGTNGSSVFATRLLFVLTPLAAAAGIVQGFADECKTTGWLMMIIALIVLILILATRPFHVPSRNVLAILAALACAVAAVAAGIRPALSADDSSSSPRATVTKISQAAVIALLVLCAIAAILALIGYMLLRAASGTIVPGEDDRPRTPPALGRGRATRRTFEEELLSVVNHTRLDVEMCERELEDLLQAPGADFREGMVFNANTTALIDQELEELLLERV